MGVGGFADKGGVRANRAETRKVIMARAELQWEDSTGTSRAAHAMLEDISRGGAGIRLRQPIGVGSKLNVKWHKEQFSGTVRHCRREGMEYVLGVQRDALANDNGVVETLEQESKAS
ncbi:MAG TPA: PilZ domain-containing protein [Bryobacteraceae bacterium]